jgi:hypothetical protein
MVGDAGRDVAAGRAAGCRTIYLRGPEDDNSDDAPDDENPPDFTVRNLVEAARTILRANHREPVAADVSEDSSTLFQTDPPDDSSQEQHASSVSSAEEVDMPSDTPDRVFTATDSPVEDDSSIRKEILRHVRQMSKQAETEEFSLINLLGGVVQILVILLLVVVFWKALGKQEYEQALLWAVVSVVLQTMSMTFFLMARSRR